MTEIDVGLITRHLDDVRARVEKAGGDLDHIEIIAVTKKHGADVVRAAVAAGITDVGENYAQEAAAKAVEVDEPVRWHFIGQLQRNKINALAPFVSVWHTVDSVRLAEAIATRAPGASVFVQVNAIDDTARGGCAWADLEAVVDGARSAGLNVRGLMGVADIGRPEDARPYFRRIVATADRLGLPDSSIGMSNDFEVAVQEGATVLRLGSVLFGQR